jgi:hypothetical protein
MFVHEGKKKKNSRKFIYFSKECKIFLQKHDSVVREALLKYFIDNHFPEIDFVSDFQCMFANIDQ